jgi:hypothetical protein
MIQQEVEYPGPLHAVPYSEADKTARDNEKRKD